MAREFDELSSSTQTGWQKILGKSVVRLKGTWAGTVQPQIRSPGDADETDLGDPLTQNDTFVIDLPTNTPAEIRLDFTRTSGTLKSEIM